MVRIVNRFDYFIIITITISCLSCATYKSNSECKLIPENNEIVGNKKNAKIFMSNNNNYYLPVVIEQLLYNNSNVKSNYKEPLLQYAVVDSLTGGIRMVNNPQAKSKLRGGYKIEGCADTTWAKVRMANHLLKKYQLTRIDSFIIKDRFRYSFIKDSIHLLVPHTDPNVIIGSGDFRGNLSCRGCSVEDFAWKVISRLEYYWRKKNDREYYVSPDEHFDDAELLTKGKYVFRYYYDQKKGIDLDELIPDMQRKYGIVLSYERTDTLKMGYYEFQE